MWRLVRTKTRFSGLLRSPSFASTQQCKKSTAALQDLNLSELAETYGTPYQLYDEAGIRKNARGLIDTFKAHFPSFHQSFAVKALPNPAILRILIQEGCGLDCSSTTELYIASKLGCPGSKTVYTSNYTDKSDLLIAAKQGVIINLDDESLVADLVDITEDDAGFPDLLSFRLNPGVGRSDSGMSSNVLAGPDAKFGVSTDQITSAYQQAKDAGATRFGIHMMTGSCVMDLDYWQESLTRMLEVVAQLRRELNIEFEFINVGGGLGIPYRPDESVVPVPELAERMRFVFDEQLRVHDMPEPALHMENGRYMTGPFGHLVSRCHVIKRSHGQTYYGLDACMANLMRPGMYGSYHHITVPEREGGPRGHANVVGTLCENNDWFAKDRDLPESQVGDLFVIHDTGAHSHSMGFNYNGKLRAPEILVRTAADDTPDFSLIRERETIEGQFSNCVIPDDL